MAISFGRATPVQITTTSDASRTIAYVARTAIEAAERRRMYDYTHLSDDLVHEEVLLPPCAPEDLRHCNVLANSLDLAELRKMRTPPSERKRQVQVALAVVVALPPETEVAPHEAVEIMKKIVIAARGSQEIPIHIAIHRKTINTHGHGTFALRPIHADGTWGLRIRDHFVRLRHSQPDASEADIVEGLNSRALTWEIHQTFFVERGIDIVVDPPAPAPGEHLQPFVFANGEFHNDDTRRRIIEQRQELRDANIDVIRGSPTRLIETLLKGRSTLQIGELHRLCERFFDNEAQCRAEVDRIVLDQNVICLTENADTQKPRYATTRRTARLVNRATDLVECSTINVQAITGRDHGSVVAQLVDLAKGAGGRLNRPLILGLALADCKESRQALAHLEPSIGTIDMAVTSRGSKRKMHKRRDARLSFHGPNGSTIGDWQG